VKPNNQIALASLHLLLGDGHALSEDDLLVGRGHDLGAGDGQDPVVQGGHLQRAVGQCVGEGYSVRVDKVISLSEVVIVLCCSTSSLLLYGEYHVLRLEALGVVPLPWEGDLSAFLPAGTHVNYEEFSLVSQHSLGIELLPTNAELLNDSVVYCNYKSFNEQSRL